MPYILKYHLKTQIILKKSQSPPHNESKLKETITRLKQQLAEEKVARLKAEQLARLNKQKSNDDCKGYEDNVRRSNFEEFIKR
jgi:hypothetical protein